MEDRKENDIRILSVAHPIQRKRNVHLVRERREVKQEKRRKRRREVRRKRRNVRNVNESERKDADGSKFVESKNEEFS